MDSCKAFKYPRPSDTEPRALQIDTIRHGENWFLNLRLAPKLETSNSVQRRKMNEHDPSRGFRDQVSNQTNYIDTVNHGKSKKDARIPHG